jgi:hypothetical protein
MTPPRSRLHPSELKAFLEKRDAVFNDPTPEREGGRWQHARGSRRFVEIYFNGAGVAEGRSAVLDFVRSKVFDPADFTIRSLAGSIRHWRGLSWP